ncbi:MAG: rhodanese-like domain-containing protein [Cyclobacteriaceae bacterium]
MKDSYLSFIALLLATSGLSAQESRLVNAEWLQNRMEKENLVIFHIGREDAYNKEHIVGAVYMQPSEYTYEDDVRVFDLPTDQELKSLFESKGVSNNKDVVIYTPKNWIPLVTRLYFTLDYLGHGHKTYILDGGLVAWKDSNGNISNEIPKLTKGNFDIEPNMNLLADKEEVLASIEDERVDIVDCRAQVYYTAIEATHGARKGRVPGAKTIPYTTLYQETDIGAYKFKTLDQISEIFEGQELKKDQSIVLYCHIGMQLTVVYTAAKLLGYKNVKMYDGSFREWGPDETLPIEVD